MPGGRPRRLKWITVVSVPRKPIKDPDHPFLELSDEERMEAVIEGCAQLLAALALDRAAEKEQQEKKAA